MVDATKLVEYGANAAALFFVLSPWVDIQRVHRSKGEALPSVNPSNLLSMFGNAAMWLIYGVFYPVPPAVPCNAVGVAACVYYLGSCWFYVAKGVKNDTWGRSALVSTVLVLSSTLVCIGYAAVSPEQAEHIGYMAMVVNIIMYGAPLTKLGQVLRDKSSDALPPVQCVAGFLCSFLWLNVGLATGNIPTMIPNGLGVILAAIQLGLIAWYPSTKGGKKD